jgi:hypothetical protein
MLALRNGQPLYRKETILMLMIGSAGKSGFPFRHFRPLMLYGIARQVSAPTIFLDEPSQDVPILCPPLAHSLLVSLATSST